MNFQLILTAEFLKYLFVANTVLIIDDDENLVELMATILGTLGITVLKAYDGPKGLEVYERERPDVVIVDWVMKPYDGLELGRRIKAIDPHAIMIVITGMSDPNKQKAAEKAGFFRFVAKPFQMTDFNQIVQDALQQKKIK